MDRGYVCLWRKLRDSDVMKHADVLQVFIALLIESEDVPTKKITMCMDVETLDPGEVFIKYNEFASRLGLQDDQLVMILNVLQAMDIISHVPLGYDDERPDVADEAVIMIRQWSNYQPPVAEPEYIDSIVNDEVPRNDH